MPIERFSGLAAVLDAVRDSDGITQPMLVDRVGLGRSIIALRVAELEAAGLVASNGLGPSTGGRAPRRLRLRSEAGFVLGLDIGPRELVAGIGDLAGTMLASSHESISRDGPEEVLGQAERMSEALIDATGSRGGLRSIALGMPEPVTFAKGAPVALPTMPDWDRYPVRERLSSRWSAPVWLDHRVNLLAIGERRVNPLAGRSEHMVYLGGGSSMAAAVVVGGRLYRGARGLAGAVGHMAVPGAGDAVCRCGNTGCLDAVVGRAALTRDSRVLAETGQSPALAAVLAETGDIQPIDITHAADGGDAGARALLNRAATVLGVGLAMLVNAYNPDLVIIGGGIARAGADMLEAIRASIHRHVPPVAWQGLRVELSAADEDIAGIIGAVQFALDELFSAAHLPTLLGGAAEADPV